MSESNTVIDCKDEFKRRKMRAKLKGLYAIIEGHDKKILDDPIKAVSSAIERYMKAEEAMRDIDMAFMVMPEMIDDGVKFEYGHREHWESVLLRRQNKIQKILVNYRHQQHIEGVELEKKERKSERVRQIKNMEPGAAWRAFQNSELTLIDFYEDDE